MTEGPATRAALLDLQTAELGRLRRSRYALRRWWPVLAGALVMLFLLPAQHYDADAGRGAVLLVVAVVTAALAVWVAIGSHRITVETRRWETADRTPQARALPAGDIAPALLTLWDGRDDAQQLARAWTAQAATRQSQVLSTRGVFSSALAFMAAILGAVFVGTGDDFSVSVVVAGVVLVVVGLTYSGAWIGDLLHRQRMANLVTAEYQAWLARQRHRGVESGEEPPVAPVAAKLALGAVFAVLLVAFVLRVRSSSPLVLAVAAAVLVLVLVLAGAAAWRARRPHVLGLWSGTGTVLDHPRHGVVLRREGDHLVLESPSPHVRDASFAVADVLGVETEKRPAYPGLPRAVFVLLRDDVVILRGAGVAADAALAGLSGVAESR